jgi:signal transduction histidine kinase
MCKLLEKKMERLPLLDKILKRSGLDENHVPESVDDWKKFLNKINQNFIDAEQERYLLERSLEISSREMLELNAKFDYAQQVAHLGYWFYDRTEDKLLWSKETYRLLGIDPLQGVPKFKTIIGLFHRENRRSIYQAINNAFAQGESFELEARLKNNPNQPNRWLLIRGSPKMQTESDEPKKVVYISGIMMDISARKESEIEMKRLHQELLISARKAGMSEIATSVLHNVGNILNSINVSVSLLKEKLNNTEILNLVQISAMIKDHLHDEHSFLTIDPKGKLIPDYLIALSQSFLKRNDTLLTEIDNLSTHLDHVKEIVNMQKNFSGISGIKEKILLSEIINLAIKMGMASLPEKYRNQIFIKKQYEQKIFITIDKAKLLQILVNLIINAAESIIDANRIQEEIVIKTYLSDDKDKVIVNVQDKGKGINQDNITKIFAFGYTTKERGHGFGLHSCALSANDLGGKLEAKSAGEGAGAEFILTLPLI